MNNESLSKREGEEVLRVWWDSGPEFIDLTEIKKHRNSNAAHRIDTSDVRDDGRPAFYQPWLQWQGDSFSLDYDDPGKFESGEDAAGDLGIATYRQQNNEWKCSWKYRQSGWKIVTPSCELLNTRKERELELVKRARRDHKFRTMILAYDKTCAITDEEIQCVLDAAHVIEVKHNGADRPENGLILRKDLHALFDARLFTIESDGSIVFDYDDVGERYSKLFSRFTHVRPATLDRIRDNLIIRNKQKADW